MLSRCCSSAAMAAACSVSVSLWSGFSCFRSLCMLFSWRFRSDAWKYTETVRQNELSMWHTGRLDAYLGKGFSAGWTDEGFLSSVSPFMVLQVRLMFKRLHRKVRRTGEPTDRYEEEEADRDTWTHLLTHLAGEWPLVAVNSFVFLQIRSSNERFTASVTPVRFEARVDL